MNAEELTLNIAVNLGRIGRFACDGKEKRVYQFLEETTRYMSELDKATKSERFMKTYIPFRARFESAFQHPRLTDDAWIENVFTWANILSHRAKFA